MTCFRILSIDGGGFRGVYPAHILMRMEKEFDINWTETFDLIAGTSTGSIIAAGLACGLKASDILKLYKEHGTKIFKKRFLRKKGFFASKYDMTYLDKVLKDIIGDRTLGEIKTPLLIPATDIGNGRAMVFKSGYHEDFVRDKHIRVREAVLSSCAAPTYFDPRYIDEKYLLADGGLWANNPGLIAAIEAKQYLGQKLENLRILSIGTGTANHFYLCTNRGFKQFLGWGFLTKWQKSRFIDMLLNLASQNANNMLGLLLQSEQIIRLTFDSDGDLPLDDPYEFIPLVSRADTQFTCEANKLRLFLQDTPPLVPPDKD